MDQLREIQRRFLRGRSGGERLPPETLILDSDKITSETTPSSPRYFLSTDITKPPISSRASSVGLWRSLPNANSPPLRLFALNHVPTDTECEYSLVATTSTGEPTLGNIDLALPPDFIPALQKTPIYALLSPSNPTADSALPSPPPSSPFIARPDVLFTLVMSFKDTIEYHTHDTNGELRFLASEDVVNGKQHLIIADDTTNQQVRDALVGMWCLRLWREAIQDGENNARRRARKKMRRLARSRNGMVARPGCRRLLEVLPLRLNRFERLKFGRRRSELEGELREGTRIGGRGVWG